MAGGTRIQGRARFVVEGSFERFGELAPSTDRCGRWWARSGWRSADGLYSVVRIDDNWHLERCSSLGRQTLSSTSVALRRQRERELLWCCYVEIRFGTCDEGG